MKIEAIPVDADFDGDFEMKTRKEWPFKNMEVGEVIAIPEADALEARKRLAPYGYKTGKKFSSRINRTTRNLHVKRIA